MRVVYRFARPGVSGTAGHRARPDIAGGRRANRELQKRVSHLPRAGDMPQTTTRRRVVEDDEDVDVTPAAEAPVRGPETMHDREHLGHEVASDLTLGGLTTFLSVTTRGVNLVAGNADLTAFIPVRVVTLEDEGRLEMKPDDAKALSQAGGVVAFLVGDEDDRDRYYVPVAEFLGRAEVRDGRKVAEFDRGWLRPFAGHPGVKRAFSRLIKKTAPKPEAGG